VLVRQRAAIGPLAKCALCGVLSVTEALACEMGDCKIVNWHVPIQNAQAESTRTLLMATVERFKTREPVMPEPDFDQLARRIVDMVERHVAPFVPNTDDPVAVAGTVVNVTSRSSGPRCRRSTMTSGSITHERGD
jgi:hypothetical protein